MRNRKITIGIIVTLVVAVVSLGIAFAAFSRNLTINGNATVQSSNWNVYFSTDWENCSNPGSNGVSLTPDNMYENGTGHIVSTLLTSNTFTWSATLKSPGYDDFWMGFYVCNSGDYDADISLTSGLISYGEEYHGGDIIFTCTQNGVVTQEAETVCSHLYSEFYYPPHVPNGSSDFGHIYVSLDDENWAQDGSDLPKNPVTVTAAPIVLTATQASSAH